MSLTIIENELKEILIQSIPNEEVCYVNKEKISELIALLEKEKESITNEICEYFCHDLLINQDDYVNIVNHVKNVIYKK